MDRDTANRAMLEACNKSLLNDYNKIFRLDPVFTQGYTKPMKDSKYIYTQPFKWWKKTPMKNFCKYFKRYA